MSSKMRWFGILLLLWMPWTQAAETRDPQRYFFDESFGDLSEELENVRDSGKRGILIMFEMDECPFCHRMKATVLNQPDVQDFFKAHFLILSIDVEGDIEMVDFQGRHTAMKDFALEQFRVRATPVFAFFDPEGNLLTRYTGATSDKQEFLLLGRYVVDQIYLEEPFARYKRRMKRSAQP